MKSSLLIVSFTLLCFCVAAQASTMSISSNPGQDVTVKLTPPANSEAGPSSAAFVFETGKGLVGPTSNPTSQDGFANAAKNVFAITVIPATKSAFVYFFLTSAKGDVILVSDVNNRAAKLLSTPWKTDAEGFLRVESIQGRKVKLSTTNFAHAPFQTHTFSIAIDALGQMKLAP
ncbi:MAG: hypothetical protein M3Z22_06405 [Verrucomicrobiota bacterium]|nr:hypothetical protein [Verrucomicrobiota bacterium]